MISIDNDRMRRKPNKELSYFYTCSHYLKQPIYVFNYEDGQRPRIQFPNTKIKQNKTKKEKKNSDIVKQNPLNNKVI